MTFESRSSSAIETPQSESWRRSAIAATRFDLRRFRIEGTRITDTLITNARFTDARITESPPSLNQLDENREA